MTRISPKSIVMGFVVLVTAAVFALMVFIPADGTQPGSMGGHDMGGMSGMSMDGHDRTGH